MTTRAEHRRATLLRISKATTEAYETIGSSATFDDIAAIAGLSRRTLFRYADSKEALVFIHPVLWLDIFDDAVAAHPDASLRERLMHASRSISAAIDADPEPVRRAMAVAASDPDLMRGYAGVSRRWIDRIAAEVRGDAADRATVFRASVLGAAVMGVIDAALAEWFASDPVPSLVELVERGLDYVAPILD